MHFDHIHGEGFLDMANVYWRTNTFCNYDCSYCWPSTKGKVKDFVDTEMAITGVHRIVEQFNKKGFQKINWIWAGGEVTFHPGFLDILQTVNSYENQHTKLVSNMSQSINWWEKFLIATEKFSSVKITASLHLEFADKQKFYHKLKFLLDNNVDVSINQVVGPDNFDEVFENLKFLNDLPVKIYYKVQKNNQGDGIVVGYTQEQLEKLSGGSDVQGIYLNNEWHPNIDIVNINGWNNFKGWSCTAGYQGIAIFNDIVHRGVIGCNKEKLGHLKDFVLYDQKKPCVTDKRCRCSVDLELPKWSNNET